MRIIVLSLSIVFCVGVYSQTSVLQSDLERIARNVDATVGIAVVTDNDTVVVNNDVRYPLMSVFKLHVALTALYKLDKEGLHPNNHTVIQKNFMLSDTYSPLREQFPDSDIKISYADIIRYTISLSDNNTCDWLIHFVGGIGNVDRCVKDFGLFDFELLDTELSMHKDLLNCYNNWSTPLASALLMKCIFQGELLSERYNWLLCNALIETQTGADKLRAGLPDSVTLAHKTGSSDRLCGIKIADNDLGMILLPDGRMVYIAVFVKNSMLDDGGNAAIIADVARAVMRSVM